MVSITNAGLFYGFSVYCRCNWIHGFMVFSSVFLHLFSPFYMTFWVLAPRKSFLSLAKRVA